MEISQITDHAAQAIAKTTVAFRESAEFLGVLGALAKEVQAFEDALFPLIAAIRDPSVAASGVLDSVARLVNSPDRPMALADVDFRTFIARQILVNKSYSKPEDLIAIAQTNQSFFSGEPARLIDYGDTSASVIGSLGGIGVCLIELQNSGGGTSFVDERQMRELVSALASATSAGLRTILIGAINPAAFGGANCFKLDGSSGATLDQRRMLTALDKP